MVFFYRQNWIKNDDSLFYNRGGWKVIIIFYVDVFFVNTFLVQILILLLSLYLQGDPIGNHLKKVMICDGVSSVIQVFLVLFLPYRFYMFLSIVLLCVECVLIRGKGQILYALGVSFYLGGGYYALENVIKIKGNRIILLFILSGALYLTCFIYRMICPLKNHIYNMECVNKNCHVLTKALYDTGNLLREPYHNHVVHIISEELLDELNLTRPCFYVPYESLGNQNGLLEVYEISELVNLDTKETYQTPIYVGNAKEIMKGTKEYQMILNAKKE